MYPLLRITTAATCLAFATGAQAQTISLEQAATALGADKISSIEYSGATGTWYRFGQAPVPGKGWPRHDVTAFRASIDFATPAEHLAMTRAESRTARARPPLAQNVNEFVSGAFAWKTAPAPGAAAEPQPAEHDSRLIEIWATPQGFLKAALAHQGSVTSVTGGAQIAFTLDGRKFEGRINDKGQVETVRTWLDDPVLGDMAIDFAYSDYRDFSGLQFPAHIVRSQGGSPVWDLQVTAARANPALDIPVPEAVRTHKAPPPQVNILQVADGVYVIGGDNYNSVAIEQASQVVVVEAPLDEARSLNVIAKIKALIPGKPIRYVINTHNHFDHAGGLRTYAAEGATIVTDAINKPYYEASWSGPRSLNPDRLFQSRRKAAFKTFAGKYILPDANRPVEIYPVTGSGHADGFAMVYLPAEKFLIEADAFNMPPEGGRPPATANPYNVNLYENIVKLNLDIRLLIPLHGRLGHIPDLRTAIGNAALTQAPRGCQQEIFYC